jgi:hypothetical protein
VIGGVAAVIVAVLLALLIRSCRDVGERDAGLRQLGGDAGRGPSRGHTTPGWDER